MDQVSLAGGQNSLVWKAVCFKYGTPKKMHFLRKAFSGERRCSVVGLLRLEAPSKEAVFKFWEMSFRTEM